MSKLPNEYFLIHKWIRRKKGSADHCENNTNQCSKFFDWALIHGKKYEKNVENFISLCRKCHHKYDGIPKKGKESSLFGRKASLVIRRKMSKTRKGVKFTLKHRLNLGKALKGRKLSDEHKEKLRIFHLGLKASLKSRRKMSTSRKGKKMSLQTKKRMSVSRKKYWDNLKINGI
jgi:hypothetical protein